MTRSRNRGGRIAPRPLARDLDEQTGLGDVYLEGLMRAQRRLATIVVGVAVLGVWGFPLLLLLEPTVRSLTVVGVPFPWLVLGFVVYPTVWLLARWYVRQAERVEADFVEAVDRS